MREIRAMLRGLALAVAMLIWVSCQGGQGGAVVLEMSEFSFTPNELDATVNQPVTLNLRNAGTVTHDFIIPALGVTSPDVPPRESRSLSFTPSRAGSFEFVCEEPGHKEGGMVGTITVREG